MQYIDKLQKNFSDNLTRLRKSKKITQSELADALSQQYQLDLKRTSLANYENKKALPKLDTLYCIAQYFSVTIDDLIQDEGTDKCTESVMQISAAPPVQVTGELLKGYADAVAVRGFYKHFSSQLLKTFKGQYLELKSEEHVVDKFRRTFTQCILENSKTLQEQIETLPEKERVAFTGLHDGVMNIEDLADALQISTDEVLILFRQAVERIISKIGYIQS